MWSNYFPQMLFCMVMAALVRMVYEFGRPETEPEQLQPMTTPATTDDSGLTPQQREWSDRAVKAYAQAQEKKWRRWNQRMFGKAG